MAENLPFRTRADYENYLARLALVPGANDEACEISTSAREGYTQPCVAMTGFAGDDLGVIAADPAKSRFYVPFAANGRRRYRRADWAALRRGPRR